MACPLETPSYDYRIEYLGSFGYAHFGAPDEIVSTTSELAIWAYNVSRFRSQEGNSGLILQGMCQLTRDAYRDPVLRRMNLMEFHDQAWFPSSCRDAVTDTLESILGLENVYAPIVPRLRRALQKAKTHQVVDLCSGGGGPWTRMLAVFEKQENYPVRVWLTDKYPNVVAFLHASNASQDKIGFHSDPVDATHIPAELKGFRTLFTSFHHFQPSEARALLQDAVDHQQGVGLFEVPGRSLLTVLLVFFVPILAFAVVPFIRPFRLSRLIWTYLIPVSPVVLFFDGIVSCLRAYSLAELSDLTRGLSASGYTWEIGEERRRLTSVPVTYLIGYPSAPARTSLQD